MEIEIINPPVLHDVIQGSDEWYRLRIGKITNSPLPKLMMSDAQKKKSLKDPSKRLNETQRKYLMQRASEILTGQIAEKTFKSVSMERGHELESEARERYEDETIRLVKEVGFYEVNEYVGGSPDGLCEDRAIEIKCPDSDTHLSYILNPQLLIDDYGWQCYGHMLDTGKDKCDLISYDPRYVNHPEKQILIVTIIKEDGKMKELIDRLEYLTSILQEMIA